jgi:hypothetical protein
MTSREWHNDFFAIRLAERKELQELFMDQRITLQNAIKEEEWDKIMNKTSAESSKLEEKEKKKADKQKDKNLFSSTENAINEKFVEKKSLLLAWMHS